MSIDATRPATRETGETTTAWSIRSHLLLLVLAVAVPLAALVGHGIYSDIQQGVIRTKTSLRSLAITMVGNTDGRIAHSRQILERLASRPLVRRVDAKQCDPALRDLHAMIPGYANVAYSDLNGIVVCSAVPQPGGKPVNLSQTAWFQKFVREKRFLVGQPFIGPITGKWGSVLSAPIRNDSGEVIGAVLLPLDLKAFDPNIPTAFLSPESRYGFFAEDGTMIWRNLDPEGAIGTKPDADAARKIVQVRDGEFESVAIDGVTRFFSVMPMAETGWIAFVGVPASEVYAEAKKRAITEIGIALGAIAIMILLAFAIARRITRPVANLENTARAVQRGDLDARARIAGPREITAVAEEFNAMIAARQQSEQQLLIAATAFESQEGMMVTDADGVILRVNQAFTDITGFSAEEAVGQTPRLFQSGRHDPEFYRDMWDTINRTGSWQGEVWDRRKSGEEYPKWLTISAVKDTTGAVTHYIGAHYDVTERKLAEQRIQELAFFDQLTGLPNRTLLLDRLKQAITASARSESHGALLFIDLDNFKTLNDTLGHDMGDLLLRLVAERLTRCVREGDTVARLGGDEFLVVLPGLSERDSEAAASTETVAKKILAALNQPYALGEIAYRSTPSIGATLFKGRQAAVDDLMKQADLAMYKAKEAGRNALRFFDPEMETAVKQRAALEADLREALKRGEFLLHYQAQVVGDGQLTGAEVLLRWRHPQRGMVPPADFIALAEETGLILPLGDWVLKTACAQLAAWATRPDMAHLTVAVNVSAHQFRHPDFVDQVLGILDDSGADPQRLKLELTESLLVENVQGVIEKMFALKARGVGFSLDDFGTGYSSLSYLKRMPLDQLKIDQSFVRDVLIDPNDAAIARTIIALAQSLGLGVIAEGVETASQREFLAGAGCHAYQGYFFSRPLSRESFEQLARQT